MKFNEYFEKQPDVKKSAHIIMLVGNDPVLKEIIVEDLGRLVNLWELRERFEVNDVRSVINLWGEGSLMGARFLDIRIKGKPKNSKLWPSFLSRLPVSANYMTICFEESEPEWSGILARSVFQVVECDFPKGVKARTKLAALRLQTKNCQLEGEMVKELAGRVKSTAELESAITTLSILSKTGFKITEREILYVACESEQAGNISHALLVGNKVLLAEQLEIGEPILLLSIWHSTLKKLYCWLNQQETKDRPQEGIGDDEDGDDEEGDDLRDLKISRYHMRDYNVAKKNYAQTRIRDLMEEINDVYQDVRKGKSGEWKERARIIISKMPS